MCDEQQLGPDELDRVIDALAAGAPAGEDPVAAALQQVRALAVDPLPPASRARHLAAIHSSENAPAPAQRARPGWAGRLRRGFAPVTAMLSALVLLGGGGTVAFAQDVDPGHVLYPVKRTAERAWVALPRGPERAAEVQLALAERRIEEAANVPEQADDLVQDGLDNVEAAADEKPEEALATFARLLGTGPDALPAQASPRARTALYRNCLRIAERHGLEHACPEPADLGEHPGRGNGRGLGGAGTEDGSPGNGRGWGPGGRPDGAVGPPPGVPGQGSAGNGRGWGPGGRPEGAVGPPPGVPGRGDGEDSEDVGADAGVGPVGAEGPGGPPAGEAGAPAGLPPAAGGAGPSTGGPDPAPGPPAGSGAEPGPGPGGS